MKKTQHALPGKITFIGSIFIVFLLIAMMSCDQKPPTNSLVAQAERGKIHFMEYCSPCHGEDAKGLIIDTINDRPADLTRIMFKRKVSEFPVMEIAQFIDGRNMVKAHGTRAMPIWGEVFSTQEHLDETQIKGKMGELIAYLMRIQE